MVRIIIGTVIDVARGRLEPGATRRALESLQRGDLGATAPPDGLYLDRVDLDIDPSDRWPSTSSAD
jgi:tRNA pseudouridine38-40 synthase